MDNDKVYSFQEVVRRRRSVRKFEAGKMVGRDVPERIVDCGRWAPSGANVQSWVKIKEAIPTIPNREYASDNSHETVAHVGAYVASCAGRFRSFGNRITPRIVAGKVRKHVSGEYERRKARLFGHRTPLLESVTHRDKLVALIRRLPN